jgi:hypothetical protein
LLLAPLSCAFAAIAAPACAACNLLRFQKDVPTVNGNSQLTLLGNIQARTDALVLPNPGLGLPFTNMFHTPAQPIMTHTGYTTVATPSGLAGSPSLMPQHWRPLSNARDNVPCNTLFIGNLGESTREEELHQLMASQPGFRYKPHARASQALGFST